MKIKLIVSSRHEIQLVLQVKIKYNTNLGIRPKIEREIKKYKNKAGQLLQQCEI